MAARSCLKEVLEDASAPLCRNLAKHVKRVHTGGRRYAVRFTVGNQTFDVGRGDLTRKEAVWYQKLFLKALRGLCRQHHFEACVDILTNPDK